jgi:hypothetical protein
MGCCTMARSSTLARITPTPAVLRITCSSSAPFSAFSFARACATYIADAVAHLRAQESLDDTLLVHTTPLTWEHIGFSGDFLWERAAAAVSKRRPFNLHRVREAA